MTIPFAWLFRTRQAKRGLLIAATYVALYIPLSLCGTYRDNLGSLEKLGIWCRCVSDLDEWQPALTIVARHTADPNGGRAMSANVLGYFFLPLVLIDQHYWHPMRPIEMGAEVSPPNRPAAGKAGTARPLAIRRHWPGLPEPEL